MILSQLFLKNRRNKSNTFQEIKLANNTEIEIVSIMIGLFLSGSGENKNGILKFNQTKAKL